MIFQLISSMLNYTSFWPSMMTNFFPSKCFDSNSNSYMLLYCFSFCGLWCEFIIILYFYFLNTFSASRQMNDMYDSIKTNAWVYSSVACKFLPPSMCFLFPIICVFFFNLWKFLVSPTFVCCDNCKQGRQHYSMFSFII